MTENWKYVDACHEVSDLGNVRYWILRRTKLDEPLTMKLKKSQDGYLWFNLHRKSIRVHRLVLEAFIGLCPEGMEARHLDGIPSNNVLSNLCWGTKQENAKDKILHGTNNNRDRNGRAKLSELQIAEIRKLYETSQFRQVDLAKAFNVSQMQISNIVRKVQWR